jgi:hypothetical protein
MGLQCGDPVCCYAVKNQRVTRWLFSFEYQVNMTHSSGIWITVDFFGIVKRPEIGAAAQQKRRRRFARLICDFCYAA